jgi:hypothetical protein
MLHPSVATARYVHHSTARSTAWSAKLEDARKFGPGRGQYGTLLAAVFTEELHWYKAEGDEGVTTIEVSFLGKRSSR